MAPLFILTPAALAWSPLFAGYYTYLGLQVSQLRIKSSHGGPDYDESKDGKDVVQRLKVAVRSHANFAEYVPLAYLLITLGEINGAPTWLANTTFGVLFALRLLHVEAGMKLARSLGRGRPIGTLGTHAVICGAGLYNLSLSWDYVMTALGLRR